MVKIVQDFIFNFKKNQPLATQIVQAIEQLGGQAVVVGGAIRDLLLNRNKNIKDWLVQDLDIEVYGVTAQQLEQILRQFGPVRLVGKSFGVYLVDGLNIDWSLPRTDLSGRKPMVMIDPELNFQEAFRRRDLTINAMGINLKTGELIDPFGGQVDLKAGVLRYVDRKLFAEDPLRFYRVMQFIGRFEFWPDADLDELCSQMSLLQVSKERIESEFEKLFLNSKSPSLALVWLQKIGRLKEILPEVHATIGTLQSSDWHPEGDVFEHTKQALDLSARQFYNSDQDKLLIMWSALCHDLGKVTHTKLVDGQYKSHGHAAGGVPLARKLLNRITSNKNLIDGACRLVAQHMEPLVFMKGHASLAAYKRLAVRLAPQTISQLVKLTLVDRQGRVVGGQLPNQIDFGVDLQLSDFIEQAKLAGVYDGPERSVLFGRDFLDLDLAGPELGRLVKQAYQIQIETGITDPQQLKQLVVAHKPFKNK